MSDPFIRGAELVDWRSAPSGRLTHPSPDHLLPLMVAVGVGWGKTAERRYHAMIWGSGATNERLCADQTMGYHRVPRRPRGCTEGGYSTSIRAGQGS